MATDVRQVAAFAGESINGTEAPVPSKDGNSPTVF